MSKAFAMPLDRLIEIASNPPDYYRTFSLPQKGKEPRLITAPSKDLKKGLRKFNRTVLRHLPTHPAASCVRGKGVVWAAERHKIHPVFLQLDIRQFFPSVSRERVLATLDHFHCHADTIELLADLLTLNNRLPQGSPTSVTVANLVLRNLDGRIRGGLDDAICYTRYLDDLSISGGKRVETVYESRVRQWIQEEEWTVHQEKGGCFGPDEQHRMLGVLVNTEVAISPEFIVDLRAALRSLVKGDIACTTDDLKSLRGKVEWVQQVNPKSRIPRLYRAAAEAFRSRQASASA